MKCGDVVLRPGVHVEMVTGAKHKLVGARGNATGGAENGKAGDQTGGEIAVIPWWDGIGRQDDLCRAGRRLQGKHKRRKNVSAR